MMTKTTSATTSTNKSNNNDKIIMMRPRHIMKGIITILFLIGCIWNIIKINPKLIIITTTSKTFSNTLILSSSNDTNDTTTNTNTNININSSINNDNIGSSNSLLSTSNSLPTLSTLSPSSIESLTTLSLHHHYQYPMLTIEELIHTTKTERECPPGTVLVEDYWAPSSIENHDVNDIDDDTLPLIPRYIHVTSKSRCMTEKINQNLQLWKNFAIKFNYNFLIHNDDAMEYLLMSYSELYNPMLQQVLNCAISPTIKTDIWRAIVLYIYGGIYTDIDNAPGKNWVINVTTTPKSLNNTNNNESDVQTTTTKETVCINKTDEAFFVVEMDGFLSQYFLASKPNHILMRILVDQCTERLLNQSDIYHLYIPLVTGPRALQFAFIHYMNQSYELYENYINPNVSSYIVFTNMNVLSGNYPSPKFNNTVTVAGHKKKLSNDIVYRNSVGDKLEEYKAMNLSYYHEYMYQIRKKERLTCRELIIQTNNYNYNNSNTILIDKNNNKNNKNNNNESLMMIDTQIDEEIKMGIPDITRQYLFYNEEIYHLKNRANIEYKINWLSTVRMTRKEQLQYRVID